MGYGYKSLVFWLNNGKHGQETHCTKMGADSLAQNTSIAPEFICPICLPKHKSSGFQCKKASLGFRSPWYWIISQTFWMKKGHFIFLTKIFYSGHCFPFRKLTAITLNKFSHIFFFPEWMIEYFNYFDIFYALFHKTPKAFHLKIISC